MKPASIFCAAGLLLAQASFGQTMFRGDATHSGVYAAAAPRTLPKLKWSFPTGDRVVSSAAWHDGAVFFGSDDGHIYAVDAASGRQRWMFRTGGLEDRLFNALFPPRNTPRRIGNSNTLFSPKGPPGPHVRTLAPWVPFAAVCPFAAA